MEQTFDHPQVYVVIVKSKKQDRVIRLDTVHATAENATTRKRTMHLEPNERAEVVAKSLLSGGTR